MSESTCKHGVWKGFVCRGCRHDEHTQAVIDRFYDSDKDGEHNGGSGLSPPTELDRLRAQIAARDRELAALKETHAAFVAKVRAMVESWQRGAIDEARDLRDDLATLLPAE